MSDLKYVIQGYRVIDIDKLEPHPDAQAFPGDADDRAAVGASMESALAVFAPLHVMPRDRVDGFWVLDGCGRLAEARRLREEFKGNPEAFPLRQLPCLLCDCSDPRRLAMTLNSAGRNRSTGSRVLCYLLANEEAVLAARQATDQGVSGHMATDPGRKGKKQSRNELPEELKPWTVREIASRMNVHHKDVTAAMELLICRRDNMRPKRDAFGMMAYEPLDVMNEDEGELMDRTFAGVMTGRTPVRRWAAAFAGASATADKAKAPVQYDALALRSITSLKGVFEHWHDDVGFDARRKILDELHALLKAAPQDVNTMCIKMFALPEQKPAKGGKK